MIFEIWIFYFYLEEKIYAKKERISLYPTQYCVLLSNCLQNYDKAIHRLRKQW